MTYIATKDYISITETCIKIQISLTKVERKVILRRMESLWYCRSDKGARKQLWRFASTPHVASACIHALSGVFDPGRYIDEQKSIREVMPDIHRPAAQDTFVPAGCMKENRTVIKESVLVNDGSAIGEVCIIVSYQ
jgi:hypothetical protein